MNINARAAVAGAREGVHGLDDMASAEVGLVRNVALRTGV